MPPLTSRTVQEVDRLLQNLAEIRLAGLAAEHEESTEGVGCVAAPVYDATGMVAALSISVPVGRFPPEREAELTEQVRLAATRLSTSLGAGLYPAQIEPGTTREL
jgi:IclR family KDG regulon transcriptional repressor